MQTGVNEMKWSFLFLITTCSCPYAGASLPCFVLSPISVPHHVVLSPQLLYPSDSRQCVLRPPTWHSSQGPQGVCVCLCVRISLCCICPHPACTDCSSHARAHCHLFVPVFQTCLCLLSVHLFVWLFYSPCASVRHQALHLGLFLHYFGWSAAETRVLADIVLGCL